MNILLGLILVLASLDVLFAIYLAITAAFEDPKDFGP